MRTVENIIKSIKSNKELNKNLLDAYSYTDTPYQNFIDDAKTYLKAIKEQRMVCTIPHVSKSGMSRIIKFNSTEGKNRKYWVRQYYTLFCALGYSYRRNHNGFFISGCGMDMVFHTNYTNCHVFNRIGIISKAQCSKLAQMTPTVL